MKSPDSRGHLRLVHSFDPRSTCEACPNYITSSTDVEVCPLGARRVLASSLVVSFANLANDSTLRDRVQISIPATASSASTEAASPVVLQEHLRAVKDRLVRETTDCSSLRAQDPTAHTPTKMYQVEGLVESFVADMPQD